MTGENAWIPTKFGQFPENRYLQFRPNDRDRNNVPWDYFSSLQRKLRSRPFPNFSFVLSTRSVGYSKKKKGDGKKIKKNPGERCFVKSYSRSWRAFVRRFMHPVSRRQFQANVPPFCCAMHSPDLFLRLSSIRKHLLFRRAMFKRVL